jgi:trehalose synthase
MIQLVAVEEQIGLDEYEAYSHLTDVVRQIRSEAELLVPTLAGRTVWMINSTAEGGGVAEMLPKVVHLMRELGVSVQWAVIGTEKPEFFALTKRIHNLIHGVGKAGFSEEERVLYDTVSRELAGELVERIGPNDLLIVHDPQPLGVGAEIKRRTGASAVWRCHIGVDETTEVTRSAWEFLRPYAAAYDHSVFSATEYIPPDLTGTSSVIYPAIDPLSHKNQDLSPQRLVVVLCNAGLNKDYHPVLTPAWSQQVQRLQPDGTFAGVADDGEIGLLFRPIVTQISRWDRLKGWFPLIKGFEELKTRVVESYPSDSIAGRRVELTRLVLAGPELGAIQDDPESGEVLKELISVYTKLPRRLQEDIAVLALPMACREENALVVNALQRCSTVVVQNSLREGFGLTATEAMWKRVPVLGTKACGMRVQIRSGIDGILTDNPQDPREIADNLSSMLSDPAARERLGRSAQKTVHDRFLVFVQVAKWLRRLAILA